MLDAACSILNVFKVSPVEPGIIDEGLNMFNSFMSRMLSGLPELASVDLSMEQVKAKRQ